MKFADSDILSIAEVGPDLRRIVIDNGYVAREASPGQFVMVRVRGAYDPLLPRPFSIHDVDPEEGTLEVVFKVVGLGTDILSRRRAGDKVGVLGPLGVPFDDDSSGRRPILVGGGVGVPPIHFLARRMAAGGVKPEVILGARTAGELIGLESFFRVGIEPVIATDDGSVGEKGFLTALLDESLKKGGPASIAQAASIRACGPYPMLRETARLARRRGADCQVSMEAHMACGMGVCLGCVTHAKGDGTKVEKGEEMFLTVCKEGPVFDARDILWEEMS